jgi:hypothetical protein
MGGQRGEEVLDLSLTTYRQLPLVKDSAQIIFGFIYPMFVLFQQRDGVLYFGVVLLQTLLQEGLCQQ